MNYLFLLKPWGSKNPFNKTLFSSTFLLTQRACWRLSSGKKTKDTRVEGMLRAWAWGQRRSNWQSQQSQIKADGPSLQPEFAIYLLNNKKAFSANSQQSRPLSKPPESPPCLPQECLAPRTSVLPCTNLSPGWMMSPSAQASSQPPEVFFYPMPKMHSMFSSYWFSLSQIFFIQPHLHHSLDCCGIHLVFVSSLTPPNPIPPFAFTLVGKDAAKTAQCPGIV